MRFQESPVFECSHHSFISILFILLLSGNTWEPGVGQGLVYVWDAQIKIYSPNLAKAYKQIEKMLLIKFQNAHERGPQLSLGRWGALRAFPDEEMR